MLRSALVSYVHRGETNHPDQIHTKPIMSQVSITLDTAVIDTFEQLISALKSQMNAEPVAVVSNEPKELEPFNQFLIKELTPHFGTITAEFIVEKLKRCNAIGDFRYFIPVYKVIGDDIIKRQLLKTVSAVYRFKFHRVSYSQQSQRYTLRSEIKYAAACPHCGTLANALLDRLKAEGLWK